MTKSEASTIASSLPPEENPYSHTAELAVLRLLANRASKELKDRVTKELLERAEGMRKPETPGHRVHYRYHVRAAAWAVENLG